MTLSTLFAPFAICLAFSGFLPLVHRRLRPRLSAAVLGANVLWVSIVAVLGSWFMALRYLTHISWLADQLRWCSKMIGQHDQVPWWLGLPSMIFAVVGAVRIKRFAAVQRQIRSSSLTGTSIVASDEVFAYVLPGRNAATIISAGLLSRLSVTERCVVLAHEKAHADFRHDRYLTLARAAEALVPLIRPLTKRLEFSLERWADDSAATALSGDRRLVAQTIAKVALLTTGTQSHGLAFVGLGEVARTRYLLDPSKPSRNLSGIAIMSSVLGLGFALYQLHHFEGLLSTLCRS